MRRRHHVVSRGYQRFFADGERILLCDKATRTARSVGTADAFVQGRFNSYLTGNVWLDELEDEWARIENAALPHVRRLICRSILGPDEEAAVKVLAAVHFVRSYSLRDVFDRIFAETAATAPSGIASKKKIQRAYRRQHGRDAQPGEIEAHISERLEGLYDSNRLFVEQMVSSQSKALAIFEQLHLQLLRPVGSRIQLITGDTPLVIFDDSRVGLNAGVALGTALRRYMPLAPTLGVMFTTAREADQHISSLRAQELNWYVWRAAQKKVAGHPTADLSRSLGTTIGTAG
jgi:hypothetical protein